MIMKLWPGYLEDHIDRLNKKLDEENGRGGDSIEWKKLEALAFFKERILEERWVSRLSLMTKTRRR